MIIDFHTHTFPDQSCKRIVAGLAESGHIHPYSDGSRASLLSSMERAGIDWSVNLPVFTRADQVEKVNHSLIEQNEKLKAMKMISFGGMFPGYEHIREELKLLKDHGIPGIKLHPTFQKKDLDDPAMLRVIDIASSLDMIVLIHAGMDVTDPSRNYASVSMVLNVLREVAPPKLVVAHMGGWQDWECVKKYLAGAPVWFDTAFSIGALVPNDDKQCPMFGRKLDPDQFTELVRMHGADRILFGTDSPWEDQLDYVRQIREMPFTEEEVDRILYRNAADLLKL